MNVLKFDSLTLGTNLIEIKKEKVLIVSFQGQITNTNAYDINRNISVVFREEVYKIILDLSELEYINSIGVATLLTIIKTVEANEGKITIGGLNHFLENVIRLMDLPKKIAIYSRRQEAIQNWSKS
jgi:anti-anti-sigma factor